MGGGGGGVRVVPTDSTLEYGSRIFLFTSRTFQADIWNFKYVVALLLIKLSLLLYY